VDKSRFVDARRSVSKIEDLLAEASELYEGIEPDILQAIIDYHNETATLLYCLRWGLQAAKEIREDWHTVVSSLISEGGGEA